MSYISENVSLIRANPIIDEFQSGVINKLEDIAYSNLFYPYIVDTGGSQKTISLTIDILNKSSFSQTNLPNKKWTSNNRYAGNLIESEPIWGFKETSHSTKESSAISNAFCFSSQKLNFHIATEGNNVGYIDDKYIYCKTTLTISYLNVIDGTTGIIGTFNNFTSKQNDSSRYFQWIVPNQNITAFTNYGLFGMIVIRVDADNEYFTDAY